MDLVKMINELRSERAAILEAIDTLERFARTHSNHRGRPPAWMSSAVERKKPVFNDEARKRMAEAQKKRWAAYRQAKASSAGAS